MRWTIVLSGILLIALGCSTSEKAPITLTVDPKLDKIESSSDFQIYGKIVFDGNSDYLPQRLKENNLNPKILLKYSFQVHYGNKKLRSSAETTAAILISPWVIPFFSTLGGGSMKKNDVFAAGKLDIVINDNVIKTYSAAARTVQERNMWSESETQTELRKRCLLEVRDNIDKQLQIDQEFLQENLKGL